MLGKYAWSHSQEVTTLACHVRSTGSIPVGTAKQYRIEWVVPTISGSVARKRSELTVIGQADDVEAHEESALSLARADGKRA